MAMARSKLTSQAQISVPVEVRKKLGIGPGSVVEWEEEGDRIVLRRVGTFSSEDIHKALFSDEPQARTLDELNEGLRRHIREGYARS